MIEGINNEAFERKFDLVQKFDKAVHQSVVIQEDSDMVGNQVDFRVDFEILPIDQNDEVEKSQATVSFSELPPKHMSFTQRYHQYVEELRKHPEKHGPFAFSIIQSAKLNQKSIKKMIEQYVAVYNLDKNQSIAFIKLLKSFIKDLIEVNSHGSRIVKDLRKQIDYFPASVASDRDNYKKFFMLQEIQKMRFYICKAASSVKECTSHVTWIRDVLAMHRASLNPTTEEFDPFIISVYSFENFFKNVVIDLNSHCFEYFRMIDPKLQTWSPNIETHLKCLISGDSIIKYQSIAGAELGMFKITDVSESPEDEREVK